MSFEELPIGPWRKSSYSNGNGGNNCVEVAFLLNAVAVRDSKNRDGPTLTFTPAEWLAFLAGVRAGEFEIQTRREELREAHQETTAPGFSGCRR